MPFIAMAAGTEDSLYYRTSVIGNMSSGEFAPYYIGSLNHGRITQKNTLLLDAGVFAEIDAAKKIHISAGAEIIADAANSTGYSRWDAASQSFSNNKQHPAPFWLQQMYAQANYRSIYLCAGLREHQSQIVNNSLSSGDCIESGNARPIPELRGGLNRYVDIPFTQGWVQIKTELSYGIPTDKGYLESHYNYWNYHITTGSLYTYKHCHFRFASNQPFTVTAGMQAESFFGGTAYYYNKGRLEYTRTFDKDFGTWAQMMIPVLSTDEDFVKGSTIGCWDFVAQYRLKSGDELKAYFQWPFEDGSGIGRRNKADGIWGLEYRAADNGALVTGVVVEYIDFRDQSGPIHFHPDDYGKPTIQGDVSGADNYFNNGYYNSFAYYGMAIGTPFLISPIYNTDGYPAFACNRSNGVHLGINGCVAHKIGYRLLAGYQRGLGTYNNPYSHVRKNTSVMIEASYKPTPTLSLRMQLALDRGKLRGNNFGTLISACYHGNLSNKTSK